MARVGLVGRILAAIGLLAIAAGAVAGMGQEAMTTFDREVDAHNAASKRAIIAKHVDGLIMAIVSESRGIYMSRDRAEAEKFAKPLMADLAMLGAQMEAWRALLPDERKGEI